MSGPNLPFTKRQQSASHGHRSVSQEAAPFAAAGYGQTPQAPVATVSTFADLTSSLSGLSEPSIHPSHLNGPRPLCFLPDTVQHAQAAGTAAAAAIVQPSDGLPPRHAMLSKSASGKVVSKNESEHGAITMQCSGDPPTSLSSRALSSVGMRLPTYVFGAPHSSPSMPPVSPAHAGSPSPAALELLQTGEVQSPRNCATAAGKLTREPIRLKNVATSGHESVPTSAEESLSVESPVLRGSSSMRRMPRSDPSVPPPAPDSHARLPDWRRSDDVKDSDVCGPASPAPHPWLTSGAATKDVPMSSAVKRGAPPAPATAPSTPQPAGHGRLVQPWRALPAASLNANPDHALLSITLRRSVDCRDLPSEQASALSTPEADTSYDTISEYAGFLNVPQSFLEPGAFSTSTSMTGDPSAHFADSSELTKQVMFGALGTPKAERLHKRGQRPQPLSRTAPTAPEDTTSSLSWRQPGDV
jgi:hypothetical protein